MKTKNYYWSALVGICCLTACSVHELDVTQPFAQPPKEGEVMTFNAFFEENDPETRTTAVEKEDGITVEHWWSPDDAINVFYGDMQNLPGSKFTADAQANSQTTTFTGSINAFIGVTDEGSPQTIHYWATYPYSEDNRSDGNSALMTMPARQEIPVGTWDPASDLYVAKSKGLNLYFYLVGGGIRFEVAKSEISKIEFRSIGNEPLAGTVRVVFGNDGKPQVSEVVSGASSVIEVTPKGSPCFLPGEHYYVNFLHGTLSQGFTATFYNEEGIAAAPVTFSGEVVFQRKVFRPIPAVDGNLSFTIPATEIWYKTKDGRDLAWNSSSPCYNQFITSEERGGWKILTKPSSDAGTIETIPDQLFMGQTTLTQVILPSAATSLGASAFEGCTSLETVSIPDAVQTIGSRAFYGCSSLKKIRFPEQWSLASEAADVFTGCSWLQLVTGGNTTSDHHGIVVNGVFLHFAGRGLREYVMPAGEGITEVGESAFKDFGSLRSLVVSEGVRMIGDYAFFGMYNLQYLELPTTVTDLGTRLTSGCRQLEEIFIKAKSRTPTPTDAETFDGDSGCPIYVPYGGILYDYQTGQEWNSSHALSRFKEKVYTIHFKTIDRSLTFSENQLACFKNGNGAPADFVGQSEYQRTTDIYYNGVLVEQVEADLIFGEPVTLIAKGAIVGQARLTSLTIPECVQDVSQGAIAQNQDLRYIKGKFASSDEHALITENGTMVAFTSAYSGSSYTVPEGVTALGEGVFSGSLMSSIALPSSLTTIGESAFVNSKNLRMIDVPEGVSQIGTMPFSRCDKLLEVRFHSLTPPHGDPMYGAGNTGSTPVAIVPVSALGTYKAKWPSRKIAPDTGVIYYQTSDQSDLGLSTDPNVKTNLELAGCQLVKTGYNTAGGYGFIAFDKELKYVVEDMFRPRDDYHSELMTSIVLPSNLQGIDAGAFNYCSGLTSIEIPETVYSVADRAFDHCTNLTTFEGATASEDGKCLILTRKDGSKTVRELAYFLYSGLTGSYSFPEGIDYVNCKVAATSWRPGYELEYMIFPEGLTRFYQSSDFSDNTNLKGIVFPNSLTRIDQFTSFDGCTSLESLTIPANVTYIWKEAFKDCSGLQRIIVEGTVPAEIGSSVFDGSTCPIFVPAGTSGIYKQSWPQYENRIQEGGTLFEATTVRSYADAEEFLASALGQKIIESGIVKDIRYDAGEKKVTIECKSVLDRMPLFFQHSSDVSRVKVPIEIRVFDNAPFADMPRLQAFESIYATDDQRCLVTSDKKLVGFAPYGLSSYEIPDDVLHIDDEAFSRVALTSITFPSNTQLVSIGNKAFAGSSVYRVDLPDKLRDMGWGAFMECPNLEEVRFGTGMEVIPNKAFSSCQQLQVVWFTSGQKSVSTRAFYDCPELTTVSGITSSVKTIYHCAFQGSRITAFDLSSVEGIYDYAFKDCTRLSDIGSGFSSSLDEIGMGAFENCSMLVIPAIPESVKIIGERAFYGTKLPEPRLFIPRTVQKIGSYAFSHCTGTAELRFGNRFGDHVKMGDGVFSESGFDTVLMSGAGVDDDTEVGAFSGLHSLPKYTFYGCTKLTEVQLPVGEVTRIKSYAFENCSSLTSIDLPEDYGELGQNVFKGCTSLSTIIFRYTNYVVQGNDLDYGVQYDQHPAAGLQYLTQDFTVYVPSKWLDEYKRHTHWMTIADHFVGM